MSSVNSAILRWARETAGLDLPEAARRIALRDARGTTGADRLQAIEQGDAEPDVSLLRRMSKQYRRPLITFFQQEIPRSDDIGEDFRTLPIKADASSPLLSALLRDVKSRQSIVRSILEEDEDAAPVTFVASLSHKTSVKAAAAAIVADLGFDLVRFRIAKTVEAAFDYARTTVESRGTFVLLLGNLGSWQTAIDASIFRGFALADKIAPFMVINDQDAKTAWSFTLFHELAHIWLGSSGVSGGAPLPGLEQFCNDIAAEILLHGDELPVVTSNVQEAVIAITTFAKARNVSRSMIAYHLFRSQRISEALWKSLTDIFRKEWLVLRDKQRLSNRDKDGGPNYYVVKRHRLGPALVNLVRRELADGSVTPTRAAKILGVKPMSVYSLVAA